MEERDILESDLNMLSVENENISGQNIEDVNCLQLEEGPLDDSQSISLDLSETTRFYNLKVEETVDQMSLASAERDRVIGSYGDRGVSSPGGNEGYFFTNSHHIILQEEDMMANKQTDKILFEEQGEMAGAMALHNPNESYNSLDSSVLTTPRSGGELTDRESVTSLQSTTGRRYLEWDYGSDLGPQYQTQGEAAKSLSQLEKLTIGSYSEYLREEPVGREKDDGLQAEKKNYLPDSEGDDMRANRFSKFADSLMRQRHLQKQGRTVSKDRQDMTSEDILLRQGGESEYQNTSETVSSKSTVKSSSMSEIPVWAPHISSMRSTSTYSLNQMPHNLSGPSSSNSAGTLVAVLNTALPGLFGNISIISPSYRSLPPNQLDMMLVTRTDKECNIERDLASEEMLDSYKVSATLLPIQSAETECQNKCGSIGEEDVVKQGVDDYADDAADEDKEECTENKGETSLSTLEDNICTSSKSCQPSPPGRPRVVWSKDASPLTNFKTFASEHKSVVVDEHSYTSNTRHRQATHSSEPSSVPTTSDEEMNGPEQANIKLVPNREYHGDTSTIESARITDKAKSFEYIPGESFQLQSNSSSYEYLPGHMVADNRPPTVLTTESDHSQQSSARSGEEQLSYRDNLDLADIGTDLDALSVELREKSQELLARNISQTKHFFKKLKGYIEFLSTPSLSVEDSRVKQELAGRIMALLGTEECRLGSGFSSGITSRALSSNSDRPRTNSQADSAHNKMTSRPDSKQIQPTTSSRTKNSATSTSTMHLLSKDLHSHSNNKTKKTGRNLSSQSSTRQLSSWAESSLSAGEPDKDTSEQTSISSEMKGSDTSSRLFDWKQDRTQSELEYQEKQKKTNPEKQIKTLENVELIQMLQEKRLNHMKKLKKEMKKMDKLDTWIAGAAGGKLENLPSSVSTGISETDKSSLGKQSKEHEPEIKIIKHLKQSSTKLVKANSKQQATQTKKSKKEEKQERAESLHHKENYQNVTKPVHNSSCSSSLTSTDKREQCKESFGQMFPTPLPSSDGETNLSRMRGMTTKTIARVTTSQHSVEIQTDRTVSSEDPFYTSRRKIKPDKNSTRKQRKSLPESEAKQKPLAYYLPMDTLSPIRIGRRVLREITGDAESVFYNRTNRNMLSGYMASLDTQPLVRQPKHSPVGQKTLNTKLSLQEALFRKRKDFLKNCAERMQALSKAKDARLLRSAKQAAWLEEIVCQSPRSQKMAEPSFTPVPVVRVFNHRDMVRATREKYNELPEVQNIKLNARTTGKYRNNRLMAQIYSSHLQRKVVRGKVSLTHHQMVV